MERIRASAEAPAVLAGSLAAIPLLDVLTLLGTTRYAGELKVVSSGADEHFRVDGGDLVDPSGNATDRLLALACADDAWFTFSAGTEGDAGASGGAGSPPAAGPRAAGTAPATGPRTPLGAVVDELRPRLAEWHHLRQAVPLSATARMATSTSKAEITLRPDQWRVLSHLGAGRRVGDVIEEAGGPPIETLLVLRELSDAGLVSIAVPSPALPGQGPPDTAVAGSVEVLAPATTLATTPATPATTLPRPATTLPTPSSLMPPPLATRPSGGSRARSRPTTGVPAGG